MIKTLAERYIGKPFLITTNAWFLAPNGRSYQAVFGTIKGIHSDKETLGIETNEKVQIGI